MVSSVKSVLILLCRKIIKSGLSSYNIFESASDPDTVWQGLKYRAYRNNNTHVYPVLVLSGQIALTG
jgi:hypothetical protein